MKKLFSYILTILFLAIPTSAFAADLEITCFSDNTPPSVVTSSNKLFDLQNIAPGETSIKTMKVRNSDTVNSCKIWFKGEANSNDNLAKKINIAFSGIYGNIVDGKATSNKNLFDFLTSQKILVANVAPGGIVERNLILTFNTDADNNFMNKNTTFDIRVISEWGSESDSNENNGDVLGTDTKNNTITRTTAWITDSLGVGGPDDNQEEVKGIEECEITNELFGYVYIDRNKNNQKDNNEKILPNISIKIYVKNDEGQRTIKDLVTNEDGYWKVDLCQGTYFVELNRNTLPKNTDISQNIKKVILNTADTEYRVDFGVEDTRNFWELYWQWILLAILLLLSALYMILKRRKVFKWLK